MESSASSIEGRQFAGAVAYLLRETFEGSPPGQPSAFLDRGIGFLPSLATVGAEQASADFGGTTLAAQTEHTKFYLDRLCEYIDGRTEAVNWDDSWLIDDVTDEEWTALRSSFQKTYESTLKCLAAERVWTEMQLGMAMGMIAHTAYHLGAIRQIAKALQK